jgi:hypothetical protein
MRRLLIILSVFLCFNCLGQYLLSGKIINYEEKSPNSSAYITLVNEEGRIVDAINPNEFGVFQFKSINEGTYKVEIYHVGFNTVIICNVQIKKDTDLCNLYIYEASQYWDESEYKYVFFGLFKKHVKDTGGYSIGYLESHTDNEQIVIDYFCDQQIIGIFKNGLLELDFLNN